MLYKAAPTAPQSAHGVTAAPPRLRQILLRQAEGAEQIHAPPGHHSSPVSRC